MEKQFSSHIGYYIQEIARKSAVTLNEKLGELDLTYAQFRVLNTLWKKGTLTQKEILVYICVKPSTLTGLTDQLVKKGLAERLKVENDRRAKKIALTDKGQSLREPAMQVIDDFEKESTRHIPDELRKSILQALKAMDEALACRLDVQ
ncbi:MarR family winged helix-turn-helix transcriptional regulator [Fusibacter sp. JL216-2]|uniref:MarR family winged helix-turn-helix transcriptional regulator n=1 Tax=Fusibacter sp. JL216-2 TaxID=3071453 RepID=UPI003D33235A